ncbi:histidinol dehydrogenase [Lacipirellula sp.]|uniref:histidinol dehydrogenase n=1 Tax=Lacipirellula sp. TaxID=2691419 RepID=UPI003D12C557
MPLAIPRIDTRDPGSAAQIAALRAKLAPEGNVVSEAGRRKTIEVFGEPLTPVQVVERICGDVRERGLPALLEYTAKLDGKQLAASDLRVPAAELAAAHAAADPKLLDAVRRIRERILKFQQAILHQTVTVPTEHGGYLMQRYLPLRRIGVCVPGGAAAYPSTVLMTVVPAQAAGVEQIAVVAPPTAFGSYNQDLLATCHELGVTEVYRAGGAQAVAALAYGVDGLEKVDKIVGPGNLFVALAKKHVFGEVDIDSIAGPSEVIVIADETTRADFTAADLIAQAEHSPGSAILITWHAPLIDAVAAELEKQLATLERGDLTRPSLEAFGALVLVKNADEAVTLANELATEHLHLAGPAAEKLADRIRYAGAIFLGAYTPVPVGDYAAGPSHVLPTGATARFASGLSANDFLRTNSMIHFTETGLAAIADDVLTLAAKEGLTGHANSVAIRLRNN